MVQDRFISYITQLVSHKQFCYPTLCIVKLLAVLLNGPYVKKYILREWKNYTILWRENTAFCQCNVRLSHVQRKEEIYCWSEV
jgi:hypothetical protein